MNTKTKRFLILNAPYLIFALLGTKLGQAARLAPGSGTGESLGQRGSGQLKIK